MSNRGLILRLLALLAALLAALWAIRVNTAAESVSKRREALLLAAPESVSEITVTRPAYTAVLTRVTSPAGWRLRVDDGADAEADAAVVNRLLDALAFSSVGDALTFSEMREMDLAPADFGLAPSEIQLRYAAGRKGRTGSVSLGLKSPSGGEVYAMVEGSMSVLAVTNAVAAAVPENADGFRPRRLLGYKTADVSAVDVRVPDAPFVKLVRTAGAWQLKSSDSAPARTEAVDGLLDAVASAAIVSYEKTGAPIAASALAAYGVDPEKGLSVTLHGPGEPVQIVFGSAVEDAVYALVQNGGAVVKVPAALAEACKARAESFRDTRLFPVDAAQVDSVTVSTAEGVCILRRVEGAWALESPVAAPADQENVAAFLQKLLSLDAAATSAVPAGAAVTVKIGDASATLPDIAFLDAAALAALHTRTVLALDSALVARVTVSGADAETVAWPAVGDQIPGSVTEALANLTASSVVHLAASPEEIARCGLDRPYRTVAVDLKSSDAIRKNLIVGAAREDGARYAMLSGSATVFTLPPAAFAAFGF